MSSPTGTDWVLVDDLDTPIDAAGQMAADLDMLAAVAAGGPPVLRLYQWQPPALSLGRFQPDDDVDHAACAAHGVEVVRRPTGGRALLHGADVTYSVAFAPPDGDAARVDALYEWLAGGLIAGLALLGVEAAVARNDGPAGPVCFAGQQGADLRVGERKLCGSAQVRRDGAVLQHGSVLRHRLPYDELDLVVARPGDPPVDEARAHLRAATVTLDELGVPADPRTVAEALVEGFATGLDLQFRSHVTPGDGAIRPGSRAG